MHEAGILILERYNGVERFALDTATLTWDESSAAIYIHFSCREGCISEPLEDTCENAQPWGSITIQHQDTLDISRLTGRQFHLDESYDYDTEEQLTSFCYYEEEPMEHVNIAVLGQQGEALHVSIKATTIDVNYYEEARPDAILKVEGLFRLKVEQ